MKAKSIMLMVLSIMLVGLGVDGYFLSVKKNLPKIL